MEPTPQQKLHEFLVGKQLYSKSFKEFEKQFSTPEKRAKLHEFMVGNEVYSKDVNAFQSQFFPEVKKKVSTKQPVDLSQAWPPNAPKPSSTQPAAPTAGKKSSVEKGGVEMNWETGDVVQKKSAFQNNAAMLDSIRQSVAEQQAYQQESDPYVAEAMAKEAGASAKHTAKDYAMLGLEAFNKGFYEQAVGGTLKGAGELMLKGVKLIDDTAEPEDIWLWQAGNAIQKTFQEGGIAAPTSSEEMLQSDYGQIMSGLGQMGAMILTGGASAEGAAMSAIPKMQPVLKKAATQLFSRPAMVGTMQMISAGADQVRAEKEMVERIDKDTYVQISVEAGLDKKLAGKKYDGLKARSADDIISEMMPTWFLEGGTEGLLVGEWFKRFNRATSGSFSKVFLEKAQDVAIGTFEGAAQEALQQWMENASAKEIYDYTLSTTEGLEQSAKVGGAVQFILESLSAAVGIKNRNTTGTDKEFLEKAEKALKEKEETLAKNLETVLTEETPIAEVKSELDKKVQAGEITQEQADAQLKEIETKKDAIQKIPEEHKMNPEVVEATTDKTKVDNETDALKEEIKSKDPAFTAEEQAKIKENELKSAELSIKASEAAGLAPDPKAVKLLEAQKESVSEGGAKPEGKAVEASPTESTATPPKQPKVPKETDKDLLRIGKMVVDPATMEMYPEGKPEERRPLSGKTAKEFANQKLDEFASKPDADVSGLPDDQVTRKILEEGSPAQVGQAWSVEPDVVQGEVFTKESAMEDAVTNSTFDPRALEGIPDLSSKYLPKEGQKAQVADLAELAEELSEQTGMNITEEDIHDYIRNNPEKKKPKKISANPDKRLLAQKFKELTGVAPTKEYVDKLNEKSNFLKEEAKVKQEFLEAGDTKPVQSGAKKFRRRLAERQMKDPTIDLEVRESIKKSGKVDYERLTDRHLNDVAEFEIAENMKTMDLADALDASVQTAKDLFSEMVNSPVESIEEFENNGAIAQAIMLKVAYQYEINGMSAKAIELRTWLGVFATGLGKSISALRGDALPEGVAGKVAAKAFESQVRELSKKGKNQTLEQILKDLRKEIEKARSKEGISAAKASAAKALKPEGKKDLKAERAAILAKIKAQLGDQSLGAVYDPEQQAEKAGQLLDNVGLLIRNLVESGITSVQEIYDNIVDAMKSIGFSDVDADRIAKDAVMREGKGTVSPLAGKSSEQQELQQEHPSSPVFEGPIFKTKQQIAEEITDAHYAKPDGRSLWAKLVEAGISEKEARAYESSMAKELLKKEKEAIRKAIVAFKKQIADEEIEGIMVHESKWNGTVDAIAAAASKGLLDDQNMAAAVAGYFGFTAITAQDVADIKFISDKMINGLEHDQILDAAGNVIGHQPIGQPAPAGTTLNTVKQDSPELIARAQKEMKVKILEIEKRNNGLMPLLASELQAAMHMGALANTGTWYNVSVGTIMAALPSIMGLSVSNPLAAINAIKAITKSRANEWSRGLGVFRDAFISNFSTLNSHEIYFEGQYTSHASLLEAAMLDGFRRQAQRRSKAKGVDYIAQMAKEIPYWLIQAYRVAAAPMAIDGLLTHPVAEYVRYIEAWNKISKDHKFDNLTNAEIAKKVEAYGQFTEHAWNMAKSQAKAEVDGMKMSGKKVPHDFEARRAKEILYQNVRRAEVESALQFVEKASLRGEMTGGLGVAYDSLMKASMKAKWGENWHWSWKIPALAKNAILLFLRVAIQGANFIEKTTPVLPMIYNPLLTIMTVRGKLIDRAVAASTDPQKLRDKQNPMSKFISPEKQAFMSSFMSDLHSKYVGEDRMGEYPKERQLGNGFVVKSDTEKSVDVALQAVSTAIMAGLAFAMFDDDDEGKLKLNDDRWIDVSASLDNNPFTTEASDGMKPYSIRYRKSDGTWSQPLSFALWLPYVAAFSILGGVRDDIVYRKEKRNERGTSGHVAAGMMDILGALGEMSFNGNAQSAMKMVKASRQADKEDSPMPYALTLAEIVQRPFKAVLPGVYRDLFVNELGVLGVDPIANKPVGFAEQLMKDVPLLDAFVSNDRFDEYGNPIYRESKPLKIVERMSFNFFDFATKNEETKKRPEWKLTRKFEGLATPGQYYPSRELKLVNPSVEGRKAGEKITDEERILMSQAVAKRKGLIINDYYQELNDLNKEELEQMFSKIHNFAGDITKYEMGYSKEKPKFKFSTSLKGARKTIEKEEEQ